MDQVANIKDYIDHTLLKPETRSDDIIRLCDEATQHQFYSVCINPSYVKEAKIYLDDSEVKVCTVVGFPHGNTTSHVKASETAEALRNGADEIDMVLHIGALKAKDYSYVQKDIEAVASLTSKHLLKVIIECSLLTEEEKVIATTLTKSAGADFVKTSTGFAGGGATEADVRLMRSIVGPHFGIKASGGIRDFRTAQLMLEAGATRLGTSAGIAIVSGSDQNSHSKEAY